MTVGEGHPVLSGMHFAEADLEDIPVVLHHAAEEILAYPRFPFAREAYVKAILPIYEYNPFLSRLLLESGRTVLFIGIMCLHARHDRAERATWPTMRRVTEQSVAHGVASPRRVHDLLRRLISTGYLEQRAAPEDRRIRILRRSWRSGARRRIRAAAARRRAPPRATNRSAKHRIRIKQPFWFDALPLKLQPADNTE
jgi:hypothetical protein